MIVDCNRLLQIMVGYNPSMTSRFGSAFVQENLPLWGSGQGSGLHLEYPT